MAASALVLGSLPLPARALPAAIESAATQQILSRANELLRGHPGEKKVALRAETPVAGSQVDVVHVLPLASTAQVSLQVSGALSCSPLETEIARVNAAIAGLAALADDLLAQLQQITEREAQHAEFEAQHAAELRTARQASLELMAIEIYMSELESELSALTDPALRALYESELSLARAEAEALRRNPSYVAAWRVEQEAQALLDANRVEHEAWQARYEATLADSERELAQAQARYDQLAATEVGATAAVFPIWDADVAPLFAAGTRNRIKFVPAVLENVSWAFEDAALPRAVPIQIAVEGMTAGAGVQLGRTEPLPGLSPLPALRPLQFLDPAADLRPSTTEHIEAGIAVQTHTQVLTNAAPRIRAALSLGAYCGSLYRYEVEVTEAAGSRTRAVLRADRYELRLRSHAPVERYTAVATYAVKAEGVPVKVICTLGPVARLDGAATATTQVDPNAIALSARLRGLGARCGGPGFETLDEGEVQQMLQQVIHDAVSDPTLVAAQRVLAGGSATTTARAPTSVANSLTPLVQEALPSGGLCSLASAARAQPVSAGTPIEVCPSSGCPADKRLILSRPAPIFWLPGRLTSALDIQIAAAVMGAPDLR